MSNDGGATHYLYHVAEAKFVNKEGALGDKPMDKILFKTGVYDNTFVAYFYPTPKSVFSISTSIWGSSFICG